jgi:hypothetical protein
MALDFSLLGQGPQFDNALTSFKSGQEDRRQTNVRNALTQYKDNPEMAAPELIANGQVEAGLKLQDRGKAQREEASRRDVLSGYAEDPTKARQGAMASGDADLIDQVSKMDANQRQVAAANADELASVALALKNAPADQRKALIQSPQMAEFLVSKGFKPEQIASFDPTDQALDGIIAQGTSLKDLLAQYKDERTAGFEGKKFDETVRHNKATEGVAGKNADSRRISATRPRASGRSSNSGVPSLPPGFVIEK